MFNTIKTSKENKERVIQLTRKLNLGPENVIARVAFAYSLANERKVNLSDVSDSQGKEYTYKVLFGDYGDYYLAMLCVHYNVHFSDKDLARYVKMHIDDGLELIDNEFKSFSGTGIEYLSQKIYLGLSN